MRSPTITMFRIKLFKTLFLIYCLSCLSCAIEQSRAVSLKTTPTPVLYGSDAVIKKIFHGNAGVDPDRDFELTIKGNGQVTLDGNINNLKPLHAEWKIPPENFSRLVDAIESSDFYNLQKKYDKISGSHFAVLTISVSFNGKANQVEYILSGDNSPEEQIIRKLQTIIKQETQSEPYIRQFCRYPSNYPAESIP